MAVVTVCDFSGTGPAGTALTVANTGAASINDINTGTSVSTATGAVGTSSFAGSFASSATSGSAAFARFNIASGTMQYAASVIFQLPTLPASTNKQIFGTRSASGYVLRLGVSNLGKILGINNTGTTVFTTTETFSTGVEYRAEMVVTIGTTTSNGVYSVNFYNNTTGALINTTAYTSSAANLGTTVLSGCDIGLIGNATAFVYTVIVANVRVNVGGSSEIGSLVAIDSGSATMAGSGTLAVTPGADTIFDDTTPLAGIGTLAVAPGPDTIFGDTTPLAGVGTLAASGSDTISGAATMSGAGTLASGAQDLGAVESASAAMVGVGTLATTGRSTISSPATMIGTSAIITSGNIVQTATVTAVGVGTLAASGSVAHVDSAAATMIGSGSLAVTPGLETIPSPVTMVGVGTLTYTPPLAPGTNLNPTYYVEDHVDPMFSLVTTFLAVGPYVTILAGKQS